MRSLVFLGVAGLSLTGACGSFDDPGNEPMDFQAPPPECDEPRPLTDSPCPQWSCTESGWVDLQVGQCPACPADRPEEGSACDDHSLHCIYPAPDACSDDDMVCDGGVWRDLAEPCTCPNEVPSPGSACAQKGAQCAFTVASLCGPVSMAATCDGAWAVEATTTCESCTDYLEPSTCVANAGCRWLEPGCGEPSLPSAGCHPVEDCQPDGCAADDLCTTVSHDPCWDEPCAACSADAMVCLPAP